MALRDVVALRRRFTGESWQEASQIVRGRVPFPQLGAQQPETVRRHASTLGRRRNRQRAAEPLLRAALLPDTDSFHQRVLETSLLLAIRDSQAGFTRGPYLGHKVFRAVSPRRDGLMVDLDEGVVERFFRALLPPLNPSVSGAGVPGLRIVPTERHLHVHLLDKDSAQTKARVIIRGIGNRRWKRIWRDIKNTVHDDSGCVDPLLDRSPRLSHGEREGFDFHQHHCGPVALGSMMLRRIGLLAHAFALDVWTGNGGMIINVEIHDGPSVFSLLSDLQHPDLGITNDGFAVDTSRDPVGVEMTFARIIDTDPTQHRFSGDRQLLKVEPPALALRVLGGRPRT